MRLKNAVSQWLIRAFLAAAIPLLLVRVQLFNTIKPDSVWGSKPVLTLFLSDPQEAQRLQAELDLSALQLNAILDIVRQETQQIEQLEAENLVILEDPGLTFKQKADWVTKSDYNQRLLGKLAENQHELEARLGKAVYQRLVAWVEERWEQERRQYTLQSGAFKAMAKYFPSLAKTYPRSFEVYATRYEAGDRKIVALPDKCLKFANGGALQCDGYAFGQAYSVAIRYEDNLVVALVGEAGPWNVDDNYWSRTTDPQPRRMFIDLPLGVPEAQAAYFDNYNGGVDQFGRLVTSPVAIDVSKALAVDLGLPPGNNKVTVSFLWTEGWDDGSAVQADNPDPTAIGGGAAVPPASIAWQTATPNPDGSIVHVVQNGQTLVGIATVYGVPLTDLLTQNSLTMQSIIQPGDSILVKPADPTATLTPTRLTTPTTALHPPSTPTPFPSPVGESSHTPTSTVINAPEEQAAQVDWILVSVVSVAVVGLVLLGWGLLTHRR